MLAAVLCEHAPLVCFYMLHAELSSWLLVITLCPSWPSLLQSVNNPLK